jgi:Rad3-related DNA helicase
MNRVMQAVGRLIRTETDRGTALLIDERYARRSQRALFPIWWKADVTRSPLEIEEKCAEFWVGRNDADCKSSAGSLN